MSDYVELNGVLYQKAVTPGTSFPAYNALSDTLGTFPGGNRGEDVLTPKLADEVIPIIRQQSYCRQFFRTIDMPTLQFNVPKITQGTNVYFVDEASPMPFTTATTDSVILTAKKLGTALTLSAELTEDNIVPILPHIKRDIAKAFALAEEEVFLYGNATSSSNNIASIANSVFWATARQTNMDTETNADLANWFSNDKRKAFNGLSYMGEPTNGASVQNNVGGRPIAVTDFSKGIRELGVFGRDKSMLVSVVSLREEETLRSDPTILTTLEHFGPSTPFLTGEIGKVFGISVVSTNLIPIVTVTSQTDGGTTNGTTERYTSLVTDDISEAFIINRNAALIGDRRYFSLKATDVPFVLSDQLLLAATERIAFASQYPAAIHKITNIQTNE